MADSITTWRLTASACSRNGALGAATTGITCFQDFFVDIDFPVSLTQFDEVSVPVAVYNYLKEAQKVTLEVQPDEMQPWYELLGSDKTQTTIGPNEVTVVYFTIRVTRSGWHKFTVIARGSRMSDAVRREVEVVPYGKRFEMVHNGRLQSTSLKLNIPESAVEDSYKVLVKIYPGFLSQVMDGLEGMLRMPHG
jgi:uncharacterized protein YfaS (alpha-2-macroglobulin family)